MKLPIHKPGYVEDELKRMVDDHGKASANHAQAVFAEALLILLSRKEAKKP